MSPADPPCQVAAGLGQAVGVVGDNEEEMSSLLLFLRWQEKLHQLILGRTVTNMHRWVCACSELPAVQDSTVGTGASVCDCSRDN